MTGTPNRIFTTTVRDRDLSFRICVLVAFSFANRDCSWPSICYFCSAIYAVKFMYSRITRGERVVGCFNHSCLEKNSKIRIFYISKYPPEEFVDALCIPAKFGMLFLCGQRLTSLPDQAVA